MAAKLRIFANQGNDDVAVAPADLGVEDLGGLRAPGAVRPGPRPRAVRARRLPVVGRGSRSSASRRSRCRARTTSRTRWRPPRSAWRAASTPTRSRAGLRTFAGRPHRLERDRRRATASPGSTTRRRPTSPARSSRCARSPRGVHLIAGGRGKRQDFTPLAPLVAERCRAVYLIGEAARRARRARSRRAGVPLHAGRRPRARRRRGAAPPRAPGEVVLLSPACASFDQYPDFEARGEHFRALVEGA